jgi:hypothetical protein
MRKRVLIAVDFDYDPDHPDDLMDVTEVSQIDTDLSEDEGFEQSNFLFRDDEWRQAFSDAVICALTGASRKFRSDEN